MSHSLQLTLDVDGTSEVTINGTAYPKKHIDEENKLYVYLPAKTAADLTFTHASEYVIVIDEENHGKRAEESTDNDVDGIVSEEEDDANPGTGVVICFGGAIASAVAVMTARKRKNK